MTSWIQPTPFSVSQRYTASEDAIRVDDFQYLYDHRHDVLYVDRTQQTLANSTTRTAAATYSVPAGMLVSSGILSFRALSRSKCTTSNNNVVVVEFEYGGTTFGVSAVSTSNNNYMMSDVHGILVADGATNVQVGQIWHMVTSESGAGGGTSYDTAALAIDSTVAKDLKLYLTNGRLSSDASWTYFYFAVFGLP